MHKGVWVSIGQYYFNIAISAFYYILVRHRQPFSVGAGSVSTLKKIKNSVFLIKNNVFLF